MCKNSVSRHREPFYVGTESIDTLYTHHRKQGLESFCEFTFPTSVELPATALESFGMHAYAKYCREQLDKLGPGCFEPEEANNLWLQTRFIVVPSVNFADGTALAGLASLPTSLSLLSMQLYCSVGAYIWVIKTSHGTVLLKEETLLPS